MRDAASVLVGVRSGRSYRTSFPRYNRHPLNFDVLAYRAIPENLGSDPNFSDFIRLTHRCMQNPAIIR